VFEESQLITNFSKNLNTISLSKYNVGALTPMHFMTRSRMLPLGDSMMYMPWPAMNTTAQRDRENIFSPSRLPSSGREWYCTCQHK